MIYINKHLSKDRRLRYAFSVNESLKLALTLLQNCGFYRLRKQYNDPFPFAYIPQNKFKSLCLVSGKPLNTFSSKHRLTRFKFRSLISTKMLFGFRGSIW